MTKNIWELNSDNILIKTLTHANTFSAVPVPVGLSVNDTVPINHAIPSISGAVPVPISFSVHDTVPINHSIPSITGVPVPVGFTAHDTVPITDANHIHALQTALTGYDIDVSDSKHLLTGNQAELLKTDMIAAANEWMDKLENPHHVPINIKINITDDDKNHPRFDGGPGFNVSTYTGMIGANQTSDNPTLESAVKYKLDTGADPTTGTEGHPTLADGAQADVVININSHYLNSEGWLDPNPSADSAIPARKVDMVSELAHEFGHGLGIGITQNLNTTTGTRGDGENTSWETQLMRQNNTTADGALAPPPLLYFTGSHAQKENGGNFVVVTTDTPGENYQHLGNSLADATDPKTGNADVMYGVSFYEGQRYEVSDLDVAILEDLGYRTKNETNSNPFVTHITQPVAIHALESALPAAIATHAANHVNAIGELSTHASGNAITGTLAHAVADATQAVATVHGDALQTHSGGILGDVANAVSHAVGTANPSHGIFGDVAGAAHAVTNAVAEVSPTHIGGILGDIANAVTHAVGTATPSHGIFGDVAGAAHAVTNAVAEASPTHIGDVLSDIANAVGHAVGNASPLHNIFGDVAEAAHAVANAVAEASPTHIGDVLGDIANAVAHAVGTAGTHGGSLWNHLSDAIHLGGETAHVAQETHAYPQLEIPALHFMEFALHH